jgi:diguanylate cyclase (GGDEF)-like protein/PAS domain S-box-containing protein
MALAASFKPHLFERQRPDGTTLEIRGTPMPDGGFVTIYTDITQRAMAERAVRDSQERLSSLNKLSSDWFWEQDAALRFTRLEGRQFTGEGEASADNLGKTFEELGFEPEAGWDAHRALTRVKQSFTETVMRRVSAQGGAAYIRVSGEPLHDGDGRFLGYRGVGRDITPQKTSEARVHYLATHDALTGLPNRFQFGQLLHKAIQLAQRYQREFAVLFIDLDRFKIINDSLGHEAGDQLLCEVAIRLKQCVRASDVVARLGGDEFVMLIQEVTAKEQVEVVARNILATAFETVRVKNQDCRVSASIGICLFPQDAQNEASLMQCADVAMYLAKAEGKNNFQFYTQDIQRKSLERLTMEEDLRRALVQGEFFLHYQAKQDLVSTAVSGVEALIRWQHPERGLVSPMQFIPLAEETGLIVPIGRWVLREACQQHVAWRQAGLPPVRMAVNLSPRQFADDHLLRDIQQALGSSGMSPDMLELEITESMVMGNVERAGKLLKDIKHLGVRLAIDDFGTGYSSLAQIKRFPIDTIKVDRSFIRDLMTDSGDRAITEAVIAMGRALSLTVVAEGVETQDQLDFLGEHACHEIQGFHFSRPVSAQQCTVFMREHAARIASVGVKAVGPGTAHVLA